MDEDVVEEEHHGECEVNENKDVDKVLVENVKEPAFSAEEKEGNVNEPNEMHVESGTKIGREALGFDESDVQNNHQMHQRKTGCGPVDGESDSMLNSTIARRVAPKRAVNLEVHNPASNSTEINNMAANCADVGNTEKKRKNGSVRLLVIVSSIATFVSHDNCHD